MVFRVIRGFCSFSLCRKIIPLCSRTDVQLNVPTKPFFREQLTRDKHRNNGQTQTTNLVRSLDLQSVFICFSSRHLQSLLIFDLHLFNSLHPSLFPVTLSEHPVRLVHSILSHAERSRSTSGRSRRITLSPFFYASTFTSTFSYTCSLLPTSYFLLIPPPPPPLPPISSTHRSRKPPSPSPSPSKPLRRSSKHTRQPNAPRRA